MGELISGHAEISVYELNSIQKTTRGTETSKYPEEEKSNEISQVVASEREPQVQT